MVRHSWTTATYTLSIMHMLNPSYDNHMLMNKICN